MSERVILSTLNDFLSLGINISSAYRKKRRGDIIDMGPKYAVWADIPGCPGYQASRCGLIRSVRSKRGSHLGILRANPHHDGYVRHGMSIDGKVKSRFCHQMVAITFLGDFSSELVVNHKNGIKHDNQYSNLEWVTVLDNAIHAKEHGLLSSNKGEDNHAHKVKSYDIDIIRNPNISTNQLMRKYDLSKEQINKIKRSVAWRHIC